MEKWMFLVPAAAVIALLFAVYLANKVSRQSVGTDRMKEISGAIAEGARAFLTAEYKILVIFVAVLFVLIGVGIGSWVTAVCFVVGALFSTIAGYCGMTVATKANVRTANAARESGMNKALSIAFSGGAVMGMCVAGLGALGVSLVYILTKNVDVLSGFSLGASSIALFARVGGGIYTKAADGTGSWAPATGDTHALYSYDDNLAYVAYYPYRDGITIKRDNKAEILKDLANNAKLQPAADQSTSAAYTGSDLMAAVASPTVDPANANKKVLTLKFEHLHALLVLKPMGLVNCVPPAGASFEYAGGGTEAGRYCQRRYYKRHQSPAYGRRNVSCHRTFPGRRLCACRELSNEGDKTILYTGDLTNSRKARCRKYYTQQVETAVYTDGSITRALQVGDYFL